MDMLERARDDARGVRVALGGHEVRVRIGAENDQPALQSLALVAAGYGLPQRNLGTVSVIGPLRMDYPRVISAVRDAAAQLSTFVPRSTTSDERVDAESATTTTSSESPATPTTPDQEGIPPARP